MPLKDLLWACPSCHALESLSPDGRCRACNTRFQRGRGARIRAGGEGVAAEELDASAWLARLPWPDLDGEGLRPPPGPAAPWEQPVQVRIAERETALRRAGDYLGRIEVFGKKRRGVFSLAATELAFRPADAAGGWSWPILDLAAIQPASSAIQLKARNAPVVSIRFQEGSVRLWEQRLKYVAREAWRQEGRGEILEFQPRIRTR